MRKSYKHVLSMGGFGLVVLVCMLANVARTEGAADSEKPGRVLYVSPDGSDDNPGTEARPWATPGYGSRQLRAGDTLIIRAGRYVLTRYDEDVLWPQASGTAKAWITIRGEKGARPVLAGGDDLAMAVCLRGVEYVRLENLEISHNDRV